MKRLLTLAGSVALLAAQVPMAAALTVNDSSTDEQAILRTFLRVGAEHASSFDGDTLSSSSFDFVAYMNHECFRPIGAIEEEHCTAEFGSLADLEEVLTSGRLFGLLTRYARSNTVFPSSDAQTNTKTNGRILFFEDNTGTRLGIGIRSGMATQSTMERQRARRRSMILWEICGERFGDEEQSACYQSNIRLVNNTSLSVEDNVFFERNDLRP